MTHSFPASLSLLMSRISLQKFSVIMQNIRNFGLSNNSLKIIAMVSMLIDHVGFILFPQHQIFRIIGRVAFPIFAYTIAEGCFYTRNRKKYLLMISDLGIACQLVSTIATGSLYQNILITFSLAISVIFAIDNFLNKKKMLSFLLMACTVAGVIFISYIAPVIFKDYGFKVDYGIWGVLIPVFVYFSPTKTLKIFFTTLILAIRIFLVGELQLFALLAIPFLILYNGKRGKLNMKYVFYIFYPAHLAVLYLINELI